VQPAEALFFAHFFQPASSAVLQRQQMMSRAKEKSDFSSDFSSNLNSRISMAERKCVMPQQFLLNSSR
jgi:hypothetical protein